MKKFVYFPILVLFLMSTALFAQDNGTLKGMSIKGFPFYIYKEALSRLNHYIPSGWMGDYGALKVNQKWTLNPFAGKTSIQIIYTGEKKQAAGWAGIYWQYPPNNWGTVKNGFDLTGAKKLIFAAKGEKGGELVEFKMGGITGLYSDTASGTTGPIELTKDWKTYEIDLSGQDLSFIIGGFCIVMAGDSNPDGCTIYLAEIYYTDKTMSSKTDETKEKKSNG